MDWKVTLAIFSAIIGVYVALIFYYRWVSKHTSDNSIHPAKAALMYSNVCEQIQKANITEHKHLSESTKEQEQRTITHFADLKIDMNKGFDRLEKCVRENNEGVG